MRKFKIFKKLGLIIFILAFALLSSSGQAAYAEKIGSTSQIELMEYVYDVNNRLVEIRLSGVTIATLTYDNNGNLLHIQIIS